MTMKSILAGPQGIRAGWRFAIFVFLLFGFSKLFFWFLTAVFHYQEHAGWFPTDFLLDGALSFAGALLAAWIMVVFAQANTGNRSRGRFSRGDSDTISFDPQAGLASVL